MTVEVEPEKAKEEIIDKPRISRKEDHLDRMMKADTKDKTIEEKIKQLVVENPDNGSIKIMKELNTPAYGNVKLNWFQVIRYLKQMDLNSKKRRIEYFKKQTAKKH